MRTKVKITLILLAVFSLTSYAQKPLHDLEKIDYKTKGDMYFNEYTFDKAIEQYEAVNPKTVEVNRKLAQAYFNTEDYILSEKYWADVTATDDCTVDDIYDYASVLAMNQKYDDSKVWMKKFSMLAPEDSRAKLFEYNPDAYKELMKSTNKFQTVSQNFNSEKQDFGAAYYNGKIVFASSNNNLRIVDRSWNWNNLPFLNLYIADLDATQQMVNIEPFFPKVFGGKHHDGPASFNREGDFMVFTRNSKRKSKDGTTKLQLFTSNLLNGKWEKPQKMSFNSREYSVGHGALSADGKTMYFSSDMAGGIGGVDLYSVSRDSAGGEWSAPENLGDKINTEGNEMFPFIHEGGLLFFASDGLPGLGGLDIFVSKVKGTELGAPTNLGTPVNSSFDDYSLAIDSTLKTGFFSSNRSDGQGSDDIYFFVLQKQYETRKIVRGTTYGPDDKPLKGVRVKIYDGNKLITTEKTNDKGAFEFYVTDEKEFRLEATKDKYDKAEETADTRGYKIINTVDIYMKEHIEPVTVSEVKEWEPLAGVNPIYFNPSKSNLDKKDYEELDKVVKMMSDDKNLIVELRGYTDCRGSETSNYVLSDKRARAAITYIQEKINNVERVSGKGLGEEHPVVECIDNGQKAVPTYEKNRRVEFYGKKK